MSLSFFQFLRLGPLASHAVIAAAILLGTGCGTKTFDDPGRFEEYVTDASGPFVQSQSFEHVTVTARFAPAQVMALSTVKRVFDAEARLAGHATTPDSVTDQHVKDLKEQAAAQEKQFEGSLYFYLTITPSDGDLVYSSLQQRGYSAYQQWVRKLLFGLRKKITLESDTVEEVPLSVYRMDRTFGLSNSRTFLLAFPASYHEVDLTRAPVTLVIEEFGLRTGRIRLPFDVAHLRSAATLRPAG